MLAEIINSDCRDTMREFIKEKLEFDAIVTDPPYEIGFMGKTWDKSGVAFDPETWKLALAILKPGGHLLAFSGSRTYHRMACAIEDAGFEIRDQIMWVFGSGFPKSHTALKPAHEPIVMARKPLVGTVASNVAQFGTGVLNIDACRVGLSGGTRKHDAPKHDSVSTYGNGLNGGGGKGREIDAGRWPANFIHDGSNDVEEIFAMQADEGTITAARFFYCAKAGQKERWKHLACNCDYPGLVINNTNSLWSKVPKICEACQSEIKITSHPTQKPESLMQYLCKIITPPQGLIFDPFLGTGTTGKAAILEGFNFVGCELSKEYAQIAQERINITMSNNNKNTELVEST